MTMQEAMRERHTVRKYTDRPIPQDIRELLGRRVSDNNRDYGLCINLVCDNSEGLSGMTKLLFAGGVNHYFVLAGPDTPDLDEKLGYCGADLILYAQTLGLNTWWVGGMYSRKGAEKHVKDRGDSHPVRVNGVIAVGFGRTQGRPHKSKTAGEVSAYRGTAPGWFQDGVEALLLAPTALNKQAFQVVGEKDRVAVTCGSGRFAGIDLGIGKYHFELGAGKENFRWVR